MEDTITMMYYTAWGHKKESRNYNYLPCQNLQLFLFFFFLRRITIISRKVHT
jgi:hypothetical protein